jgi:hypothetical protein
MDFPLIPCNLCGSQENLQRKEIKAMLADWERASRAGSSRSRRHSATSRRRS